MSGTRGRLTMATWWLALVVATASCASATDDPNAGGGGNGGTSGSGNRAGNNGTGGMAGEPVVNIGGFGGLMGGTGEGGMMGCNDLTVSFEKLTPTVLMVVDRSTSMIEKYPTGGQQSRWDVLKSTILDPMAGIVKPNESEVRFGLITYTSTPSSQTCPVTGKVDIAEAGYEAINAYYGPLQPPNEKGDTPTAEALKQAIALLDADTKKSAKTILLATDGEPDTCAKRDPNCGQDDSIAAVQEAFTKGIRTYVVGIGNEVGAPHLQALANAGAGLPVTLGMMESNWLQYTCGLPPESRKATYAPMSMENAKYYQPADKAALANDLKTIVNAVRSCKFMLKGKVVLARADQGSVALDDVALKYGDEWRMNTDQELEILGAACQKIQTSSQKIAISFPCDVFNDG